MMDYICAYVFLRIGPLIVTFGAVLKYVIGLSGLNVGIALVSVHLKKVVWFD